MSRIYVANHVTLDGVMQAPGRADEDARGGFSRGGWATARSNDEVATALGERVMKAGGMRLLLGRRSYDDMLTHWNAQGGPFKDGLNSAPKYVVSASASTTLLWPNSTLVSGDVSSQVAALKAADGPDLCVMGSGSLIQALLASDLIDEFLLFIHPIILGTGRRLFPDGGATADLRLLSTSSTSTGVAIASFAVRTASPRADR
ncbi:dihydrofolate reductase family protein [Microbacterium rhizosphaerae]|uniref:Dihydrofolate reductase family protein n=1 Tax=Microbacterium rhizosphaerae TaxID=1678237 RepID=A0ABZ0SI85_9MICO|nr:dihydrofolate reductase family protein [Microbacterium rhizosphaerae]WPR88509.1 dihydrofolate reductase family protein [Microbacterium rhizosphaerae]